MIPRLVKNRMQIAVFLLAATAFFQGLELFAADFPNLGKLRLASVPGGSFVMGSREGGPGAEPREAKVGGFRIGRYEVTVGEFADFLNAAGVTNWPGSPQIAKRASGHSARWLRGSEPVAFVSLADAERYCRWLSGQTGETVRLPTEEEWEYAARGGIRHARYPWGWGDPRGRACFDAEKVRRAGSYEANPFGLYDMAGNVFEWCGSCAEGRAPARGGSWAEKDPKFLRVFHRALFACDYRDADVGFRVLVEDRTAE